MNFILKLIQFHFRAGLAIGLLFPFFLYGMSASAKKLNVNACNLKKICYRLNSEQMITSQIVPLWKFYNGSLLIQSTTIQKINFIEATWDQRSETYYIQSQKKQYMFQPFTGELKLF